MKLPAANARRRGFTLAEVLAALMLMAIVVPVAMQGVSIASRAGTLGQRKAAATRVAQRVLHEVMVTGATGSSSSSGSVTEENTRFEWTLETTPWNVEALEVITVRVTFTVQGDVFDVGVSTLFDPASTAATATSTPLRPMLPRLNSRSSQQGFTLLEIILATAVAAIVLVAIQTVFFGALRLRNTTNEQGDAELGVHRALEFVRRDLGGIMLPGGALSGDFRTVVDLSQSGPAQGQKISPDFFTDTGRIDARTPFGDVQRVSYYLTPSAPSGNSGALNDSFNLVRAVTRNLLPTLDDTFEEQTLLSGVREAQFEYFDGIGWSTTWDSTATGTLPSAIRFSLVRTTTDTGGSAPSPIETIVPILVTTAATQTASTATPSP